MNLSKSVSNPPSTLILNGSRSHNQISFTYDSGFEDNETLKILNVLRFHKVKATFFLTGIWVEKFPDIAKLIYSEGHEIGNHSYDHPDMIKLPNDEIIENILKGEDVIKKITGINPRPLFREPFGSFNKKVFEAVGEAGYKYSIYWSIDTIDWKLPPTRVIVNRILKKAKNGDIVLMHLAGNNTAESTDIALKNLKTFGFKLVTVGELLKQNLHYK
ncbi:polysaccharide deacetylase family protein [Clostridium lundense]|uniref:polysaccharide deacetylase family protein n=1 Tax=Clostridium lundense TaxID=319475 RepID=UPI0006847D04|nr:polysaccharide deacetylase family protein [Clostridium lundense]